MKENQAMEKGYRYTGSYERNKDTIKEQAKEYKAKGYKVVICNVPDSKLSRGGGGMGYSIYAEPKYFIDKEVKELNERLNYIESRKQYELDKYNNAILEIENEKSRMETRLKELNQS